MLMVQHISASTLHALAVRRPGTVSFLQGLPGSTDVAATFEASSYVTSSDGAYLALVEPKRIEIVDGSTYKQVI